MRETQVQSLTQEDLLEKEMTTHSSILGQKNLLASVHEITKRSQT